MVFDELSYRRQHRNLTTVTDHATGAIVWCAPGRNRAIVPAFFDQLGEARGSIRAVSIGMSGDYQRAIRHAVPGAGIYLDPFQVWLSPAWIGRERPSPYERGRMSVARAAATHSGPVSAGPIGATPAMTASMSSRSRTSWSSRAVARRPAARGGR